jgi:hypothetical protein
VRAPGEAVNSSAVLTLCSALGGIGEAARSPDLE